ncbi:MAG TPA: glycosyl hydrolase family 38, partial [Isosphaeraceae bacterium]|nr:glycosyl hydrolase family 38 [Isosphaeraceae bacterium]
GWTLVALIAHDGSEPPATLTDHEALGTWCAVSALWHPSLLARTALLPRIEDVEWPSYPSPRDVRVIAAGAAERLPSGYRTQAEDAGAVLFDGGTDRNALVRAIRGRLGAVGPPEAAGGGATTSAALDFFALGTARWWLRDLTIAMGHIEALDVESLTREVLTGAHAWQAGDRPAAVNRLRAAFELLTQARERFYPVDAYLMDLALLDPTMPAGALADALEARAPVSFLAPARAVEALAGRDPDRIAALRAAISEGWADVVGGSYAESDEPLLPFESILWQFRRAGEVYRRHLDARDVETVARRRFCLYPQLPQLAKRFGFRFALHMGFDAGRFPVRPEAKRLWEGPDGSDLETLTRPPLAADRPVSGLQLPWRIALTMKDDHVATLPLVHWPNAVAPWYLDLRRVAAYSPVLARWVTLNDYFHRTDRPFERFRPELDDYVTPYLAQAVARRDAAPISRRAAHARLRARLDALEVVRAVARSIMASPSRPGGDDPSAPAPEDALETDRVDEARAALDRQEPAWAERLARGIVGTGTEGRPGSLVLNPVGIPRRVPVLLADAAPELRPEGPLRAAQPTDEGVWAVVELPAFGYAWIPRDPAAPSTPTTASAPSVRHRLLRNESLAVEIDAATGGIRGLHAASETTARLGQQLVVAGLSGPDGASVASKMVGTSFEVDSGGPALVQAVTRGAVLDPRHDRRLAAFQQRFRLWSGRPLLEIDITLTDLDPDWLARIAESDPWAHALACRWAWPDPNSMLRRTSLLCPVLTEADRPETPDALDISTRRQRTALLFGGLAHHRRHGPRMLDTLLVAGRESARSFRLGVALDLEHPFHAALDLTGPAFVVPTAAGPPRTGPSGWFFRLDNEAVAITRIEFADDSGDGRGWGVAFHLIETAGRAARCRLRTFRNPVSARQTDFRDGLILELPVEGDAVLIDLTPHEMARVDVTLG